jgi:hypothetical protein
MLSTEPEKSLEKNQVIQEALEIINSLRPLLPIQNPMPFFVHNNPLQYWEKFSFQEGIEHAVLTYENAIEEKSRALWRDLEDFVIPLVLSYIDQGINRWTEPSQKNGLWDWYCNYISSSLSLKSKAISSLKSELPHFRGADPLDIISKVMISRYSKKEDWTTYLNTLVFHFKGWSGMIQVLEKNPSVFPLENYHVSLLEWIAILVTAENALNEKKQLTNIPLWNHSFKEIRKRTIKKKLNKIKNQELMYYRETIQSLQKHVFDQNKIRLNEDETTIAQAPDVQVFFCLDDREESLRRALESVNANYETFGTVGFFGIDFSLKRPGHVIFQPQCPPVITPRKMAEEKHAFEKPSFLKSVRQLLPYLNESRFTFIEPLLALVLWPLYAIALLLRSFSPKFYHSLREWLRLDHYLNGESHIDFIDGYTLEEKATIVSDILGGAGLKSVQSKLVIILGHASTTTNNPFQKSYGCGACSGQSGFSNAKVFAEFANDPMIRLELVKKNIMIDDSVYFLAACHDTSADKIYYGSIDESKVSDKLNLLEKFKADFEKALQINKEERWDQFHLPNSVTATERAADWSQPRPEFGHSLVALSVFGPRWLTKGLDLKRRSFLVSYEPSVDHDGSHLAYDILSALPVCANINLDYFTSSAFPEALGAGSKLPLNIASGIGLMTGSKGDLKIGLATQMVDQHDPLRLLAFVYCETDKLQMVISKSARLQAILKNNWIHLIRIDPKTLHFEAFTEELKNDLTLIF